MYPLPSPMMISDRLAIFVAAGTGAADASIPVSSSGAQVGDLILVYTPGQAGSVVLGGTGWTGWTDSYGSTAGTQWKVLSSTADITVSNISTEGNIWAIFRGPQSAAKNSFSSGDTSITFGATSGAIALLIFASIQTGSSTPFGPAANFTVRASAKVDAWVMTAMDTAPQIIGPGTYVVTGYGPTDALIALTAIELRAQP